MTGCSISIYFKQILIATSFEPQVLRTIFQSLFKGTKITTQFPKRQICNTSYKEINTSFAIHRLLSKSPSQTRPYYTMLWNWLRRTIRKTSLFPRNTCSYESSSSEKVAVRKKHALRKSTDCDYSFWRKSFSEIVTVLKRYLSSRRTWLEKAFLSRSSY